MTPDRGLPVAVAPVAGAGMVALRAELSAPQLVPALAAAGLALPGVRRIVGDPERAAAWMAPDELLLLVPRAEVAGLVAALGDALAGSHALVADVSDARVRFRLSGAGLRDLLAKLCPVDLAPAAFAPGDFRRTRAAQVAAAIWLEAEDAASLLCARSVASYMQALLAAAAAVPVGLYPRDP